MQTRDALPRMGTGAAKRAIQLIGELHADWEGFLALPRRPDELSWFQDFASRMYRADQSLRDLYVELLDAGDELFLDELGRAIARVDLRNQHALSSWLESREWPRRSVYGEQTCEHAWMVVLHADGDLDFQQAVCMEMERLRPHSEEEVDSTHYAALFDRIRINLQQPLEYGMFYFVEEGERRDYPVREPESVASRRRALGLSDRQFRR